jgi:glucosamine 6-phosphate synthetase-like amidotransferase/phosphosugar isomerase protein
VWFLIRHFNLLGYSLWIKMNCQLAAYIGDGPIAEILLKALEYQEALYGGHATGVGVLNGDQIDIVKAAGPVNHVKKTASQITKLRGTCAIAHSRYSDNARVNPEYNLDEMAHPYISDDGKIALMHNGVISNYKKLWKELEKEHTFRSYSAVVDDITDSEVAVHMLQDALEMGVNMVEAFQHVAPKLTGTFLLGAIHTDEPDTVYICNWYQPCYVALGKEETMFVSSRRGLKSLRKKLDRVFQPPKNSILKLTRGNIEIHTMDPTRKIPQLVMNQPKAIHHLKDQIKEAEKIDVRKLFYTLHPKGWAEVFDVTAEEWLSYRKAGIYIMNPYFELLEGMVENGDLVESIDPRHEGGIDNVPRYSYELS